MNYKEMFEKLIGSGVITCWKCHSALKIDDIVVYEVDSGKIRYKCGCGNRGYRSMLSMREEARRTNANVPESDPVVDYVDFDLPFTIQSEEHVLNRSTYTCSFCKIEFDVGDERSREGHLYCPGCFSRDFVACHVCENFVPRRSISIVRSSTDAELNVCRECTRDESRFVTCDVCGRLMAIERMHGSICTECLVENDPRYGEALPILSFNEGQENRNILSDKESEI